MIRSKSETPCYNCNDRTATCHSDCQLYLDFIAKGKTIKQKNLDNLEYRNYMQYKTRPRDHRLPQK